MNLKGRENEFIKGLNLLNDISKIWAHIKNAETKNYSKYKLSKHNLVFMMMIIH